MGCSDSLQGSCRRHPSPAHSPGVCSACLRERLSLLSDSDRRIRLATAAAASPSSEASPALARRHHQRNASEAIGSARFAFAGAALTKSRSIAVEAGAGAGAKSQSLRYAAFPIGGEREKKVGFWAKLIGGASGKRKSHGAAKHHRKGFREGIESGI